MDHLSESGLYNLKQTILYLWETTIVLGIWSVAVLKRLYRTIIPPELKSLKGEVILITGAGNGIGKQITLHLANLGARLVCWDVESEANSKLVNELCRSGTKAYAYTVDLSKLDSIKEAADKVKAEVGAVTVVINNAGIMPDGSFLKMKSDIEEKTFRVNVLSHFEILRQFMPAMIDLNHGHIVTVASLASFLPARELAGYSACKHANYGFLEALKQELEEDPRDTSNLHFTTVYPCVVKTRVMDGVTLSPKFPSNFPMVTPEFVGATVVKAIRQNVEHLFIPKRAELLPLLRALIPSEVNKRMLKGYFKVIVDISKNRNNNL